MTTTTAELPTIRLDDNGALVPFTEQECLTILAHWAGQYPAARFVVVGVDHENGDAAALGWGLQLPDHAFAYLPELKITASYRRAEELVRHLNKVGPTRLLWVDPEPTDDPEYQDS